MVEQPLPPPIPLKWASVPLQEIIANNNRLDASFYDIDGRQTRTLLAQCKWPVVPLCGKNGLATSYNKPRFKRVYVEKSNFPLYQPSQICDIYPKPSTYISSLTQTDIESLKIKKAQVLLTCSGTIGNCSYARNTLSELIFSHDLIRIIPHKFNGYIYAYLKSDIGFTLVNTNNYGAVISHIEPEHLHNIPIPNPPDVLKQKIHNLIEESFKLRDDSNELMDEAQSMLKYALKLPNIETLKSKARKFNKNVDFLNFSIPLSELNNRLDGSYHIPVVQVIEQYLNRNAKEVTHIGDTRISRAVTLPSRFKRVYVEEGNGIIFFGGKQIHQLDPSNKKYLSLIHHRDRIEKQLTLNENMTLITSSGTIGKVTLVPKHWQGYTANQHIIRVVPASDTIAGYVYAWLVSDYAYQLITRFTYGAVIDEIDDKQISRISIPFLQDIDMQKEINDKVLKANKKRAEAYYLEQKALKILDEQVIYARND